MVNGLMNSFPAICGLVSPSAIGCRTSFSLLVNTGSNPVDAAEEG